MAFLGFLKFALKSVDLLAWPSCALGYPLCASIRAIETNSNQRMRKLIAYWILFSLISLCELAFAKLIEWVPIWPYIKLVVICCLVLPRFKGAYYAYKSFVCPCLSVNLEELANRLNKPEQATLKAENFLAVAERYVVENGTEALEKLIACKGSRPNLDVEEIKAITNAEKKEMDQTMKGSRPNLDVEEIKAITNAEKKEMAQTMKSNCRETNFAQKDIKAEEVSEKNTAAAANKAKLSDVNLVQTEKKATETVEVKEIATPSSGEETAPPEKASLKKVQREWTCAVCQVKTTSEITLNSHLGGRNHKAKCEELKAKAVKQTAKTKASFFSTTNSSVQSNHDLKNYGPVDKANETKKQEKNAQIKVNKSVPVYELNKSKTKIHEETAQVKVKVEKVNLRKNQPGWCAICHVPCNTETDWISHLHGKKHLSKVQEMAGNYGS